MESSVLESEAEDSGKETANTECKRSDGLSPKAKTNGKCKLASTKSLNIRNVGGFISVGFSLTKRLRMWIANYGHDFRNHPE